MALARDSPQSFRSDSCAWLPVREIWTRPCSSGARSDRHIPAQSGWVRSQQYSHILRISLASDDHSTQSNFSVPPPGHLWSRFWFLFIRRSRSWWAYGSDISWTPDYHFLTQHPSTTIYRCRCRCRCSLYIIFFSLGLHRLFAVIHQRKTCSKICSNEHLDQYIINRIQVTSLVIMCSPNDCLSCDEENRGIVKKQYWCARARVYKQHGWCWVESPW